MTRAAPHPRLSLNQATVRLASLPAAAAVAADAGYSSIGLWREPVQQFGLADSARLIADHGLRVSSLCRGGFFTMEEGPERRTSIDDNRRAIDEAHALGAATLVLVAGGLPEGSRDLVGVRERVGEALGELVPYAAESGVMLGVEPLHPMYASDRAVISTLAQALDVVEQFPAATAGVVIDTFHLWWDPAVVAQIVRAGAAGRIASYQVCDWATPLPADVLLARHYPGDGVIDFAPITRAVEDAGYRGDIEIEIFNEAVWSDDFATVVRRSAQSFEDAIAPHLG